jgi:hypothetical protein
MTLLQKAVSPRLSRAYLDEGYDRVGGYVVRVPDVRFARTTQELAAVHGLHDEASGWTPDAPWIDLLRFDAAWYLRYLSEPGFVVPLWWLLHTRVPPGTQLVRRYADGGMELLARYGHLGTGWTPLDRELDPPRMAPLSVCAGPVVLWHGTHVEADVVDDRIVVATSTDPRGNLDLWPGAPGRWYRQVDPAQVVDVFNLDVSASWCGMRVRVADQSLDGAGRQVARIVPAADDVAAARTRGMTLLDLDVAEAWVSLDDLTDLRSERIEAPAQASWRTAAAEDDAPLPVPELPTAADQDGTAGADQSTDPAGWHGDNLG